MPIWAWSTRSPSKWSSRCLPRLSAPSSTRPSNSAAGRPSGRRRPGVRVEILLPARRSSIRRASLRTESPSISCDELARLTPEAGLDHRRLQARPDNRLAVHTLDCELLDLAGLSGGSQLRERLGELLALEGLKPQDSLAATLDVEQRLSVAEHHVRTRGAGRTALPLELGPGERRAVGVRGVGGGQDLQLGLGLRQAPQALDGAGQRELGPAEALHEVAAPSRAEQLQVLQLAVDRGEAAGDALGDGGLAGDDPVALQHQLREG